MLVSLLRGDAAAQEIQLAIEYAPNPVFHSGTPENASAEVLQSFQRKYEPIGTARQAEAVRYAADQHNYEQTAFTQFGQFVGTPEYMSPEAADLVGGDVGPSQAT